MKMSMDKNEQETRRVVAGGSNPSPKIFPRPKYPSYWEIFKAAFVNYTRPMILCVFFTKAVHPYYLKVVNALKAKGYSDNFLFMVFSVAVHSGVYWTVNTFFYMCDKFKLLQEYKLPRNEKMDPKPELLRTTWREAVVNQFLISPVMAYYGYDMMRKFKMQPHGAPLDSWWGLYKSFFMAHFINDWGFYWVHRAFHTKLLYKFHKQHHNYVSTIGFAAEYAGVLEQIFANQSPSLLGMTLFAKNPLTLYVWLLYRLEETYEGHSGYCFANTFLGRLGLFNGHHAAFHDQHHARSTFNFGTFYMDALFGTCDYYLENGRTEGYMAKKAAKTAETKPWAS